MRSISNLLPFSLLSVLSFSDHFAISQLQNSVGIVSANLRIVNRPCGKSNADDHSYPYYEARPKAELSNMLAFVLGQKGLPPQCRTRTHYLYHVGKTHPMFPYSRRTR